MKSYVIMKYNMVKVKSPFFFSVVFVTLSTSSCKKAHTPNPSCPIPIFLPAFFVCSNLSASPQSSPLVQLQAHVGWSSPQLLAPKKAWRERRDLSTDTKLQASKRFLKCWPGPIIFVLILFVQLISFIFLPYRLAYPKYYISFTVYISKFIHILLHTLSEWSRIEELLTFSPSIDLPTLALHGCQVALATSFSPDSTP